MDASNSSRPRPGSPLRPWLSTTRGRLLLGAGVLLLIAAIAAPVIGFTRMMSPSGAPPASRSQLSGTRVGGSLTVVVRLDERRPDGSFTATLLEPDGDRSYRATGNRLRVAFAPDTRVQMGAAQDLRAGAVLQADGVLTARDAVSARGVTVLTGVVRVAG